MPHTSFSPPFSPPRTSPLHTHPAHASHKCLSHFPHGKRYAGARPMKQEGIGNVHPHIDWPHCLRCTREHTLKHKRTQKERGGGEREGIPAQQPGEEETFVSLSHTYSLFCSHTQKQREGKRERGRRRQRRRREGAEKTTLSLSDTHSGRGRWEAGWCGEDAPLSITHTNSECVCARVVGGGGDLGVEWARRTRRWSSKFSSFWTH